MAQEACRGTREHAWRIRRFAAIMQVMTALDDRSWAAFPEDGPWTLHREAIRWLPLAVDLRAAAQAEVRIDRDSLERLRGAPAPRWEAEDLATFIAFLSTGRATIPVVDALDVPFTLATNQQFYEEFGDIAQPRGRDDASFSPLMRSAAPHDDARPYRYAWADMERQIAQTAHEAPDPRAGRVIDYVNPLTNGPVLATIHVFAQVLPPGFAGELHRETASNMSFVVRGEGRTIFADREIDWDQHDTFVTPNWTWRRHVNRSKTQDAILVTLSDRPILSAFGFFRQEDETSPYAPALATRQAAE